MKIRVILLQERYGNGKLSPPRARVYDSNGNGPDLLKGTNCTSLQSAKDTVTAKLKNELPGQQLEIEWDIREPKPRRGPVGPGSGYVDALF